MVADLDTGVDGSQPDLAGNWRSTDGWFDPYGQHGTPTDINGHGTWTTSVMVGRDGGGRAVGVAPDARWIAARVFDDRGRATLSGVHAALQWALNPSGNAAAPDPPNVLNASWSSASNACSTEFQPDLAALRAAGIVPVFAAGNSGPAAGSGTSPSTLPEALAVGGVDANDLIDPSSSRGPAGCAGRTQFPDVVAPGVNIPVDDLYGGTWTASGTSLAAPHVAGALALLLSAHPGLTADQQQAALLGTAHDLGAAGIDPGYGSGRIDVVAADASIGGPPSGPTTSSVGVTPNPVGGTSTPTVTAVLTAGPGGAPPAAARVSLDSAAPTSLAVTSGSGSTTASAALTGFIADGTHTVAVSAADNAGTWGQPATAAFVVDRTAPAIGALSVTPSPTAGASTVTVASVVTEAGTGIALAELWVDADPGTGHGVPVTLTAGPAGTTTMNAGVSVSALPVGTHTVSLRARDAALNTSVSTIPLTVTAAPPTTVFADGFESGTTSGWSGSTGSGLSVTTAAALSGRYGLSVTATRTGGSVRMKVPVATGAVNGRVLVDPRAMTTGSAVVPITVASTASAVLWTVQYRKVTAGKQVRLSALGSKGGQKVTAWVGIPATGTTVIEVDTVPSTGSATLYVGDTVRGTLGGLTSTVPALIDVGLVGAQPNSVSGAIRLDAVTVTGTGHIGLSTPGL